MKHFVFVFIILFIDSLCIKTFGQGSIQGRINDSKTGEAIIGASVYIEGTTRGTFTDTAGFYKIVNLSAGSYNIIVSFISYRSDTLRGIKVSRDRATPLDHNITEVTTQLSEVSVTARKKTDTEISVLNSQKTSNLIIVGVSSQQISKSQDKDASEVVRRLPGVTIMGGRFIVVRGLIERYNTVWLNQTSTPSSETDQRAFSFDVLPSNMINNMVVYKTPAPEIPADFAGAFIQISTKNIPDKNNFNIGYTASYNEYTSFNDFQKYEGSSTDWLGFDNGTRKMPSIVPSTNDVLNLQDYNNGTPAEQAYKKQQMLDIAHSFSTISSCKTVTAGLDHKINIDFSRIIPAGNATIGTITALSYRTLHNNDDIDRLKVESYGTTTTGVTYSKIYNDHAYDEGVVIGAISNWSLSSRAGVFEFNNLFNQTGISSTIIRNGIDHYRDDNKVYKTMLGYSSRTIYSGSIGGTHNIGDQHNLRWAISYSYANESEPDNRLINYYAPKKNDSVYYPFQLEYSATPNADANARLFSDVRENDYSGNINYQFKFHIGKFKPDLRVGIFTDFKDRNFYVRPFGIIWAKAGVVNNEILHQPIDSVYYKENFNYEDGVIYREVYDPGYQYKVKNDLYAGYLAVTIPVGKFLSIYGGVRTELYKLWLYSPDQNREFVVQATRDTLNFFPSVNITFNINDKNLFRLAYGKTVNRPEYREIAPFTFYNFKENVTVYGNPNIKSCYINNFDFRYEWYPAAGEIVTLGGFYKIFSNPIEATWVPSSGGEWDLYYLNAIKGTSLGAEIDIRKGFQSWKKRHDFLRYFRGISLVVNAAYIWSRVETNPEYLFVLDQKRPMFGQSPYIVNAGIYYQTDKNDLTISLLYNVFGKRIVGVGTPDIPNSYEMPRNILDFTIIKRFGKGFSAKFGIKDILNQEVLIQQTMQQVGLPDVKIPVKSFRPGRQVSLGISYSF